MEISKSQNSIVPLSLSFNYVIHQPRLWLSVLVWKRGALRGAREVEGGGGGGVEEASFCMRVCLHRSPRNDSEAYCGSQNAINSSVISNKNRTQTIYERWHKLAGIMCLTFSFSIQ